VPGQTRTESFIHVVDSHTAGEPTRVVISGGPDLGNGPLGERRDRFHREFDAFRSAIVNEPRGSDVLVGALLCEPTEPRCAAGVIFFNNVGNLGMCGHGLIGVVATLNHLGRITSGDHRFETPVGIVAAQLHADGKVTITNVPSYRKAKAVSVDVGGIGRVTGDVAWGGNWFFLTEDPAQELSLGQVESLAERAWQIRQAVNAQGFPEVDHIEFFGPPRVAEAHSKNFVLCPGRAYDRSPCGTGTSAKLACLAEDGLLAENEPWIQEGILGTTFTARFVRKGDQILPSITGSAYITAESKLRLDRRDPFCWGIPQP